MPALLQASQTLIQALFPAGSNHVLSGDAPCTPDIHFFIAREGAETLGAGALAVNEDYGEVKSMLTAPEARGKGIAAALLRQNEDQVRALNLPYLRLATGFGLDAAHRLYERHGFARCAPSGDAPNAPYSLFMEKSPT